MVMAEVSIVPLGTKSPSVSEYVARALGTLEQEPDIKYELTPMGTIIEGEWSKVLNAVKKMHDSTFSDEIVRVVTTIKIDDRRDKALSMRGKIESVQKKLRH